MPAGKNMFEILWERLDELTDQWYVGVKQNHENWRDSEMFQCKGEMLGVAFAIQNFSHPFFQEEKAVAKHAYARWLARQAEETMPDTPGVNGYNPLPPAGVALRATSAFKRPDPLKGVSDETKKQIKAGLAAGFTATDLIAIYKVNEAVVEALR